MNEDVVGRPILSTINILLVILQNLLKVTLLTVPSYIFLEYGMEKYGSSFISVVYVNFAMIILYFILKTFVTYGNTIKNFIQKNSFYSYKKEGKQK